MYRVTFKDGRTPINIEADKMQCCPGCVEFFKRNADGHFEEVLRIDIGKEKVQGADWVEG